MPKRRSKRKRKYRQRKRTKKMWGGGLGSEEAEAALDAHLAAAQKKEAAAKAEAAAEKEAAAEAKAAVMFVPSVAKQKQEEIKEKYHAQLKKEIPIVKENVKKVEEEGVIRRKPNETTKNNVGELGSTKFESEEDIDEEIKIFNHDISIFNFAEFIIKSIFFGVEEKDVESQIEDKLFKILQRVRLKVKKAIDELSKQGKQGVSEQDANAIKEVLDQHFQLFHDSLINDLIQRGQMDKKENEILNFFKRHSKNIDNISEGELRLNRTPYEFDKVTRFLKAYQINQKKIVKALTNMLKKVPKIGVEALKIVPFIGDGVIVLDVIDDASEIAEDLATINAVSETLGGERYHPEQGQLSLKQGRTRSNTVGGKKTNKRITKKHRITTKKHRTTIKKRRTKRRKTSTRKTSTRKTSTRKTSTRRNRNRKRNRK